jgi:hypothetical protein
MLNKLLSGDGGITSWQFQMIKVLDRQSFSWPLQ